MIETKVAPKIPQALLDKKAKAVEIFEIAQLMAANPLIKEKLLKKLNDELFEVRDRLENGIVEPEQMVRFLQGRIQAYKEIIRVVSPTI